LIKIARGKNEKVYRFYAFCVYVFDNVDSMLFPSTYLTTLVTLLKFALLAPIRATQPDATRC